MDLGIGVDMSGFRYEQACPDSAYRQSYGTSVCTGCYLLCLVPAEGKKSERAATHFWCTESQILLSLVPLPSSHTLFPPKITNQTNSPGLESEGGSGGL